MTKAVTGLTNVTSNGMKMQRLCAIITFQWFVNENRNKMCIKYSSIEVKENRRAVSFHWENFQSDFDAKISILWLYMGSINGMEM